MTLPFAQTKFDSLKLLGMDEADIYVALTMYELVFVTGQSLALTIYMST